MNKDCKIVFFDIDGTIFEFGKGTPDSTREALSRLKENGHIPVICSGRTKALLFDEILELDFPAIISGAGSHVEWKGKEIRNHLIAPDLLERTVEQFQRADCLVVLEGPEYLSYDGGQETRDAFFTVQELYRDYPERLKILDPSTDRAGKMTVCIRDPKAFDRILPEISKNFTVARYEKKPYAEILPAGVTKATGIQCLIDYLGILPEHTYAFGDGPNDLEMMQYVQYGIAMGNSDQCILDVAKYRTESIWEDGVYLELKRRGLI